ncbi:hypothetical protein [Streptomyces sp. NPDC020996]|uniref:hypothetical protein n=1 Tax=Streptomyces sp. NPDC020996 TaxID=3154791 RepID=UPI0033FEBA03
MVLLAAAGCGQYQAGAGSGTAGDQVTEGLVGDLKQSGFQVSPGYARLYTQQGCKQYTQSIADRYHSDNAAGSSRSATPIGSRPSSQG